MTLQWKVPHPSLQDREPPLVMGILNVTPDSFSDGGRYSTVDEAVARAWEIAEQGADILDIGGESTRPGSDPVPLEEERKRVVPVVQMLVRRSFPIPISVDTTKSEVARECLAAGARVVNDTSALRDDERMGAVAAQAGAAVTLMHRLGPPKTMQENPSYTDVVEEVTEFLRERVGYAIGAGIARERLIVDPGIGFGKRLEDNLALLGNLGRISRSLGMPVLVGASRKRFIGMLLVDAPVEERLEGSLASVAAAVWQGAEVVRVHDVVETLRFLRVLEPIRRAGK